MNFGRRQVPPLPTFASSSSSNVPRTAGAMPKAKAKSPAITRTATIPVELFPTAEDTFYRPQRRVLLAPISSPETYFRGNQTVRVTPPTSRKIHRGNPPETMGETSAPSGLLRQGNEPLGEGKSMSKAVRQRKKKTTMPTQKPVLPYNVLKNDRYFVR